MNKKVLKMFIFQKNIIIPSLFSFLLVFVFYSTFEATNSLPKSLPTPHYPIVVLLAYSRSLSTAFLRMMEARKDFIVMNEPCTKLGRSKAGIKRKGEKRKHQNDLLTFEEIKTFIFEKAQQSAVFAKDDIEWAHHYQYDTEFISSPYIRYIILIRNPHHILLSLYNRNYKLNPNAPFYPSKFVYQKYQELKKQVHKPLILINAEDLYITPEKTAQQLCQRLDIAYTPMMLQWEELDKNFNGERWYDQKGNDRQSFNWHLNAVLSTGFKKQTDYKTDPQGNPTFEEISNPTERSLYQRVYAEDLPYYHMLLQAEELIR